MAPEAGCLKSRREPVPLDTLREHCLGLLPQICTEFSFVKPSRMSLLSQPNETKQFKPRPYLADYFAQTAKIEIERRNQKKRPLARAFFISDPCALHPSPEKDPPVKY
jgi:hypothetical protein